jgi:hypothetical protein
MGMVTEGWNQWMLKVVATIAAALWIIVGMAELVSLAPPPVNELPVNNAKTFNHCTGDQTERSSGMRYAFCEVGDYIHNYHEDINALSTFLIMVLTILLSVFNASLVRSTKMAAVAAQKGLTELERPWIFLEGSTITRRDGKPASSVPNNWYISLRFKNVRRMPAIIDRCLFEIRPKAELPDKPVYSGQPGLGTPVSLDSGESFDTQKVGQSIHENVPLVFYGRIDYTELNGKTHETGFALEVSPNIAACMALGNKAYGYYT